VYLGEKFKARLEDLLRNTPYRIETFEHVLVDPHGVDHRYQDRLHVIVSVTG
jgi:hypothetical protein